MSNFVNFVALQFAPQSLIAPLGSMSLVVNVIAAPLINKEKFTWKDIVGVILIVGGSSMTVAFAGVSDQDYNLCVLLALFRRTATIVFLTVTSGLIATTFITICVIEKNLDFKAPSPAVDQPTNSTSVPIITSSTSTSPTSPNEDTTVAASTARGITASSSAGQPILVQYSSAGSKDLEWTSTMTNGVYYLHAIVRKASRRFR